MLQVCYYGRRLTVRALIATAALFFAGCSSEVPTYQVHGKVVYADDGQPVPGGVTIVFESTEPPHRRASGEIDAQGNFDLSSRRQGDGAMEGEHRIRFTAHASHAEPDPNVTVSRVMDPKYCEFATSGLTVDIDPNDENNFTLKVEKPPGGVKASAVAKAKKEKPPDRSQDPPSILSPDLDVE